MIRFFTKYMVLTKRVKYSLFRGLQFEWNICTSERKFKEILKYIKNKN